MNTTIGTKNQVNTRTGIAYALPVVPVLILMSSSNVLSGIYATHHGLSLAAISMVMLIAGLFDAVTDPSIGYFSDRYHARTGSRRPFVIIGAVLLIPCAWFLLNPGEGVTITYFLIWYLLFYLAITLFQIPHLTWGGEISSISEEKTKVFAYRNYGGYMGMIIFALVPVMPFSDGSKVTPESMRHLVVVAGVLLLPTLYMMCRYVPSGVHRADQGRVAENPVKAIQALAHSKPLLWLLAGSVLFNFASAFYIGLEFMVVDVYLGIGEYYVYLVLFHLIVAMVAIKPAAGLILRIGKIKAWQVSAILLVFSFAVYPFILLNNGYTLTLYVLFEVIFALASAIGNVAIFSLLSDVSDHCTLKTGIDRSATCFSLQSLATKTCLAIGIALSIGLAGGLGFDPTAVSQGAYVYWGLSLCIGVIPIVFSLSAIACISRIGITAHRHAVIRKRLDLRTARAEQNALQIMNIAAAKIDAGCKS